MEFKLEIISQIVEIEHQLASTKFTKSGCIYFKDDVPENMSRDGILVPGMPFHSSELERFVLGPLNSSGLWRHDRAAMNMNRGPCEFPLTEYNLSGSNHIQMTNHLSL